MDQPRLSSVTLQYVFFMAIFTATLVVTFLIFKPYLGVLFLAAILAVLFWPLNMKFAAAFKGRRGISAVMTTLVVLLIIIIPLIFLAALLVSEAADIYTYVSGEGGGAIKAAVGSIQARLVSAFPQSASLESAADIDSYVRQALGWFVGHTSVIFGKLFNLAFLLVLLAMALFYFLKEGDRITESVIRLSPLSNEHDKRILDKASASINAVVKGKMLTSLLQGLFIGIGFAVFGMPEPVFFGFITVLASFIPIVGIALVVVPSAIFLYFYGELWQAIGFFIWGIAGATVDDFLSSYFINRGMKINSFLILLSILGGLELFGPVGFIAGPVVIGLLFVLADIYGLMTKHGREGAQST